MRRTERPLSLFDRVEHTRREEGEDRRPETRDRLLGHEHGFAPISIRVDAIQHFVLLCDATPVNHAIDPNAMLGHSLEHDSGVKGGPFDRREQLIGRGVIQVPAEGDPAEVRVDEHRAVTVVPRQTKQAGLTATIFGGLARKLLETASRASSDRLEDVADAGQTRLDTDVLRMHRAVDDTAHAWYVVGAARDCHHARRRSDDVHNIAFSNAGPDRVPMRIECPDGYWDSGLQSKPLRPGIVEVSRDRVGRAILSVELVAYAGEQRINTREKLFGREATE